MRWAAVLLGALTVTACSRADPGSEPPVEAASDAASGAALRFVNQGTEVRSMSLAELKAAAPAQRWTAFDPYYNAPKTWQAMPLEPLIAAGFAGHHDLDALRAGELVLRARDGYTVPIRGERLLEGGAYIAFGDAEVSGWEPIGPQRANPGPFYLVWRGEAQQALETHPRPWQLASIEVTTFAAVFPHTVPTGAADGSAAMQGFGVFKAQCIRCHAINREGGRVGPELNVPQSIVEYRPAAQIKAYIRDPGAFRYGNMPGHPGLSGRDLDALIAYFEVMKGIKHDPDAGKAAGH